MGKLMFDMPSPPGAESTKCAEEEFSDWLATLQRPENLKAKPYFDEAAKVSASAEERRAVACGLAGIPAGFAWPFLGTKPDRPNGEAVARSVFRHAEALSREPRVIICGGPGKGKTSLAVAMLRAVYERSRDRRPSLKFVGAHRLATARIQHPAGEGESPFVEMAMTCGHLVIDDLDEEIMTATDATRDVLVERHSWSRPYWITTNLLKDDLTKRFSGKALRRLTEDVRIVTL